jgi:hypothetical protein
MDRITRARHIAIAFWRKLNSGGLDIREITTIWYNIDIK